MRNKEEQSIKAYNKKAGNYENTFDGRFTDSFKEELINRVVLKENFKVLDVACGTGALLNGLTKKCPIEATGIDISDKMIEVARSKFGHIHFLVSGCAPLKFENETFDVITVSAAFHHFPNPTEFANEAFRVLKSESKIYIAEVCLPNILRQVFNIVAIPLSNAGDVKIYSSEELKLIFEQVGFINVSILKKGKIQFLRGEKK